MDILKKNELVDIVDGRPVTTSLAIAEGVNNPHASVIKLIRTYIEDLQEFGNIGFEIQNSNGGGRPTEFAILNERQVTLVFTYMRNNDTVRLFKKKLVRAFFDLAEQLAKTVPAIPEDYGSALRLAADEHDKRVKVEAKLIEAQPKLEALDRLTNADGTFPIRDAAKILGMRPKDLTEWLSQNKWIYRRVGNRGWIAYQDRIQSGYLHHIEGSYKDSEGYDKVSAYCHVTAKGMTKLAEILSPKLI